MNTMSPSIDESAVKNLKQARCPKCRGLLFEADAEGLVEIKCRKCGYLIKFKLTRVIR